MAQFTLQQCDDAIADLEAKIAEAAELPDSGQIGGSNYSGMGKSIAAMERQLRLWMARRALLLNGGVPVVIRRGYGGE